MPQPPKKPIIGRTAYVAMSLLVVWHTLAMVVATAPESDITRAARAVMNPYLTLFRLDNNWGFFAPDVPRGMQFRYVIEDAGGTRHTFIPEQSVGWLHPNSILVRDRYRAMMLSPDVHVDAMADALCRKHADLKPVNITLIEGEQREFTPDDWLNGRRPLDEEFVQLHTMRDTRCPSP
jgi:hypothetical protein